MCAGRLDEQLYGSGGGMRIRDPERRQREAERRMIEATRRAGTQAWEKIERRAPRPPTSG